MRQGKITGATPCEALLQSETGPVPRILVVDDDIFVRQLHIEILLRHHYLADGASDGAVGWKALGGKPYDLLITDNAMPKVSGVELAEKVLNAGLAVPIIMVTGIFPEGEFIRRPWLQQIVILKKPVTLDELVSMVKKVLARNSQRPSAS
jgi:DNA-binding response OmpR family regulator